MWWRGCQFRGGRFLIVVLLVQFNDQRRYLMKSVPHLATRDDNSLGLLVSLQGSALDATLTMARGVGVLQ
jgi:hypothetical protein